MVSSFFFQSFADIARATSEQLLQLPGFGQVKVRRMKDAFEKPFRNNVTSTIPFQSQQPAQGGERDVETGGRSADKGKEKAMVPAAGDEPAFDSWQRHPREPSPDWDIELDLNTSPPPASPSQAVPASAKAVADDRTESRKRPSSPVWDIELDLNGSDVEDTSRKRHRVAENDDDASFEPTTLL